MSSKVYIWTECYNFLGVSRRIFWETRQIFWNPKIFSEQAKIKVSFFVNLSKTKAMYINCLDVLKIGVEEAKNVQEFKYLGLILSNSSRKPEVLL